MTPLRKLAVNSAIYTFANLLQKGAAFLLLPLYTRYLAPSDYGILAVVTALNGFLSILFTLGLTGAITRYYFEHRDEPQLLAQFIGTALTFIALLTTVLLAVLMLTGQFLLKPLIGTIPFWPYIVLGMAATMFLPLFNTYLVLLQMQNDARRYVIFSLANFAVLTTLTILLVVVLGWGVIGSLVATLVTAFVFALVALWMMRSSLRPSLHWGHLRPALMYGLPLVPHSIATQSTAFVDRIVLNSVGGAAVAGVYSVGAMVSTVIEVAAQSVNRAYVPMTMDALKRGGEAEHEHIRAAGTLVVAGFLMLALSVGAFADELLRIFVSRAYWSAAVVVPWLALAGAVNATYLVFVNVLFYERSAVRLVPVGTLVGAGCSVTFTLLLIPVYGLLGAAVAALLAQSVATILIAVLARRVDPVRWNYARVALGFVLFIPATIALSRLDLAHPALTIFAKLGGIAVSSVVAGLVFWRAPWALFVGLRKIAVAGWALIGRQPT